MKSIDARTFLLMLRGGAERLEAEQERVNALNVFPVPDGDTGTNMALTMRAALEAAEACGGDHLGRIVKAAARGALLGARGNSGVILSQFFRGLAEALEDVVEADTYQIVHALESAAKAAYESVLKPVEGTMLSVGRAGAEAAREAAEQGLELSKVLIGAFEGARKMLQDTPRFLDVLREAGVVDAGGEGLLVAAYGSLGALQNGTAAALARVGEFSAAPNTVAALPGKREGATGIRVTDEITFKYCTEFLVHGAQLQSEVIKSALLELAGDSLLVVGDAKTVKVHIHTNEPWSAMEICASFGDLSDVSVGNMVLQNLEAGHRDTADESAQRADERSLNAAAQELAAVAVVQGSGFRSILSELGCSEFVEGGQSMNPSTEEMLAVVEAVNAAHVILLPNNRNVRLAAEQVARLSSKRVSVLPTTSMPQAIAAMMAFSAGEPAEKVLDAMRRAMQSVRVGEITRAVRDAKMNGWTITEGQTLSIAEGEIVGVSDDLEAAVYTLVETLRDDDSEIITLYYGADVTESEAEALVRLLQERFP
ncbi:MAG: DAK2 domain-containing protein, partial [Firmicutes bacterium]|nr:DAK2 domain-containing protein [Bacillota bacterium]